MRGGGLCELRAVRGGGLCELRVVRVGGLCELRAVRVQRFRVQADVLQKDALPVEVRQVYFFHYNEFL